MPLREEAPVLNNPLQKHFDEPPLTMVRDMEDSMLVDLLAIEGVNNALLELTECGYNTHACTVLSSMGDKDIADVLHQLVSGGTLWQGLECIHFKFRVRGVTRIFTHQLVRQRIGITFSQQCSGEVDWRHANVLLPRIHAKARNTMRDKAILAKVAYADMVDSKLVSLQEARYVLPHSLETFIYFDCSLATAIAMYQKRICPQTNCWEMVHFAKLLKEAILRQLPALHVAFQNPCEKGKCWYNSAKQAGNNVFLYRPDAQHDNFDWHPDSFIYDWTHQEMSTSKEPVPMEYYIASQAVDLETFNREFEKWL